MRSRHTQPIQTLKFSLGMHFACGINPSLHRRITVASSPFLLLKPLAKLLSKSLYFRAPHGGNSTPATCLMSSPMDDPAPLSPVAGNRADAQQPPSPQNHPCQTMNAAAPPLMSTAHNTTNNVVAALVPCSPLKRPRTDIMDSEGGQHQGHAMRMQQPPAPHHVPPYSTAHPVYQKLGANLSKALKSVVKVFSTIAWYVWACSHAVQTICLK